MEGPVKRIKNHDIKGLTLLEDFLTVEEERQLLEHIDAAQWNTSLKRRTQHYGFEYNYTSKDALKPAEPIPEWLNFVIDRLKLPERPDQVIVNEYKPGQGIAAHIDNTKMFGDTIVSVSLGSQVMMDFTRNKGTEREQVLLSRRSAVFLTGEARYKWFHAIAPRLTDGSVKRTRRVSLTFRKMK